MATWLRQALEAASRDDAVELSAIVDEHCLSRGSSPLPLLIATNGRADLSANAYMRALICGRTWPDEEAKTVEAIRAKLISARPSELADARWTYYGLGRGRESRNADHYVTIVVVGENRSGKDAFATRLGGMWWRRGSPTVSGSVTIAVRLIPFSPSALSPLKRQGRYASSLIADASGLIALTACDTCDPTATPRLAQLALEHLGRMPLIHVTSKCDLLEAVPEGGSHISALASPIEALCGVVDSLLAQIYAGPIASVRAILPSE
jgi:hypothetical protein